MPKDQKIAIILMMNCVILGLTGYFFEIWRRGIKGMNGNIKGPFDKLYRIIQLNILAGNIFMIFE